MLNEAQKLNLKNAFRELRKLGYFARRKWTCCSTCGWAGVPDDRADKVVFINKQSEEALKDNGYTFIQWAGKGKEITEIFKANGIATDWNGTVLDAIKITV